MLQFKHFFYTTFFTLLFGILSNLLAQQSEFNDIHRIQYFGEDLFNKHGTSPQVIDWNGDGLKDLVVGFHFAGWVYVYLNSGTNIKPLFDTEFIQLKADDEIIAYEYM